MSNVRVFDPAMCCSTGICGTSVDPRLVRFAADLDWLNGQGVPVERFNLSQQPGAFAGDPTVREALQTRGEAALPLVKVDDVVMSAGVYPSRAELASWAGLPAPRGMLEMLPEPMDAAEVGACCAVPSSADASGACCGSDAADAGTSCC